MFQIMLILWLAICPHAVVSHPVDSSSLVLRSPVQVTAETESGIQKHNVPGRECGTPPAGSFLRGIHKKLKANPDSIVPRGTLEKRASKNLFTVDTYFHIVQTKDMVGKITKAMVTNQFSTLQKSYAPSSLSFNFKGADYTTNDDWAMDNNDADMKTALRKGNYSSLNVYFQTNLSTTTNGQQTQLLGYCTLPTNVTYVPCDGCAPVEFPSSDYSLDGCNVLAGSMPGAWTVGYNMGKTAVHEIGHWFGLMHIFQDNTCDSDHGGDLISDTPQQSVSTVGCPAGKDSCPGSPGLDAIHNYMDYSTDACYEGFTPMQIGRMQDMYRSLRYTL